MDRGHKAHGSVPLPLAEVPAIVAVTEIARRLILNEDELLSAVALYDEKNGEFETEPHQIMLEMNNFKLADTISRDLEYLDLAFDVTDKDEKFPLAKILRSTILAFRDTFFNVKPQHEDLPDKWHANDSFFDAMLNSKTPMISSGGTGRILLRLRAMFE